MSPVYPTRQHCFILNIKDVWSQNMSEFKYVTDTMVDIKHYKNVHDFVRRLLSSQAAGDVADFSLRFLVLNLCVLPGNGTSMSAWSISISWAVFDPGAAHMSRICTESHANEHFRTISFFGKPIFFQATGEKFYKGEHGRKKKKHKMHTALTDVLIGLLPYGGTQSS